MPGKYQIEAMYRLRTNIEPEGFIRGIEDADRLTDYEDMSSWYSGDVEVEGGTLSFVIEADSEDEARDLAQSALDGAYYQGDSIEWEIADMEVSSIEEIVPPMDMARAKTIILVLIDRMRDLTEEERSALRFVVEELSP